MSSRAVSIVCADCGQERRHYVRGLCAACAQRRRRAGTLADRPLTNVRAGSPCRLCGRPSVATGLCRHHYNTERAAMLAARAGRVYRPRQLRRAPNTEFMGHAPQQRPCRQCGTTIRPQHSGGLCTDCVRAAGGLHTDPWEAT